MNKYFIQYDKENYEVLYIHYKPFDRYYGLNKLEEDLLKEGAIITSLPEEPVVPEGKTLRQLYNPKTNELYYELVDIKLEDLCVEDRNAHEIKTLKEDLLTNMLVNVEMYDMMLASSPTLINNELNVYEPLVNIYTTLIKKGAKTLKEVPSMIREKVENML